MPAQRLFAGACALLGWLGLALQLWFSVRLSIARGAGVLAGLWLYLGFYTILTNALVAMVLSSFAGGRPRGGPSRFFQRPGVQTAAAMSIVIVCLVYNLMLRTLWHPTGWLLVSDAIVHDVMPLLYLLFWWFAVPKGGLRWPHVLAWQCYPAGYFVYVLLRGAVDGWYPYPFLDVNTLGYAQVLLDAIAVLAAFVAVGLLLVAAGRWQARRQSAAPVIA